VKKPKVGGPSAPNAGNNGGGKDQKDDGKKMMTDKEAL
jgi:hypothetical protein